VLGWLWFFIYKYIDDISCENALLMWEWWEYILTLRLKMDGCDWKFSLCSSPILLLFILKTHAPLFLTTLTLFISLISSSTLLRSRCRFRPFFCEGVCDCDSGFGFLCDCSSTSVLVCCLSFTIMIFHFLCCWLFDLWWLPWPPMLVAVVRRHEHYEDEASQSFVGLVGFIFLWILCDWIMVYL
jgi:hypothetical protein